VELLCRKERNLSGEKSHVTFQEERLFAEALHVQKFFSRYEIFGLSIVLYYSTNLKMTCPDKHKFITKQASKCCHCLTCTVRLKYINRSTIGTFKLVYETNIFHDKLFLVNFHICDTQTAMEF
jgi:hypothetical protein